MPIEILMPALSPTMEEGNLSKWLVKEGDAVKSGDIIAEIETDKAVMEFEAVEDGLIKKLLVEDGTQNIKINTPIAIVQLNDEKNHKTTLDVPLKNEDDVHFQTPLPEDKENHAVTMSKQAKLGSSTVEKQKEMIEDPNSNTIKQSVREAIRDAMAEEMRSDSEVFLMGEEVADYQGAYKVSQGLVDEFGNDRIIDTPITEHGFTGVGIGAAFTGLKPIVEFMTFNFAMQAMDQIVNSAAKTLYMSGGQMGCPIVFRGPNGAAARVAAQHSQDLSAWFASIPGLKVVHPYSASDAKGLLKSAIRDPNPVVFLENELLYGDVSKVTKSTNTLIPIGKAKIVQSGSDLTFVSFGIGIKHCLVAAEILQTEGFSIEIIDLRSLRPIDKEIIINSVKKTNRCITVEEGFPVCSIGNYISSLLMEFAFDYLDAPVLNCSGKDVPMPYAANLEKEALISPSEIVERAKQIL
ncbi:MAG: pyruvate dehydrogenase complex E1 component subunit beta [Paracoccaceae bacterium]|nr:pyruvate dehydrogenase complex E1 component subunit beta [Paracoccaceae bacterium]